ncbi:MAG: GGDEF domain-containing protein [Oscillospiraceae bacterium]|nr:GGDEF domain-containing protein [Oscillospiraceae bacterium]
MGFKNTLDNFIKCLAHKNNRTNLLDDLSGILDAQDSEIFVIRSDADCLALFANTRANTYQHNAQGFSTHCKATFAQVFPDLCANCPYGNTDKTQNLDAFQLQNTTGHTYSGRYHKINWIDGKPATIFMLRDITLELETKDMLYALAYMDQLTGIPNRQRLKNDFSMREDKIARNELGGIIALFDIDHFKAVNDTYGHPTGDAVLSALAKRLENDKCFFGHLYRLGGDEFVLLFFNAPDMFETYEALQVHYTRILSTALREYTLPDIELKCTLSIGVSTFPAHGTNLSEILHKADIALYQAKESGRNRIVFFEEHAV